MIGDNNFRIEFDLSDEEDPIIMLTNDYHNKHMLGGTPVCHYKSEDVGAFISKCEKVIKDHMNDIPSETTLTVGFTEMQVKAYQPVTGLFYTYGPENISGDATEFRADQKLFFDICHRDLGKCKIKGHYNGEGIFIITNIEVLKEK